MPTKKITDTTIITIDGKEYLTFPQALDYIKITRGLLHQRIMRDDLKKQEDEGAVNAINISKYVFVPLSFCKKLKIEQEQEATVKKLKRYNKSDLDKFEKFLKLGVSIEQVEILMKEFEKAAISKSVKGQHSKEKQ